MEKMASYSKNVKKLDTLIRLIMGVKFCGFSEIPPYIYRPLFWHATILPVTTERTKVKESTVKRRGDKFNE